MSDSKAEIEAGEWLARLDGDEPSAADLAEFERWKEMDARNAGAYARLAATWQALGRVRAIRPSADEPIDNDYLNGVRREAFAASTTGQGFSRRRWLPPAAAAAILLAVFTGFWMVHIAGGTKTFGTGIGGFQRIVLQDQSVIELNTNSEVRVALTLQLRKVELVRGEASFEVAHDALRPFIVLAGNTAVRAVGTKFNVRRLETSVEVTVDEGKVAVGEPSLLESKADLQTLSVPQLNAGQSALASGSGVTSKSLPKGEVARKLAWQNQMLVFDGDTLAEVVTQFNRYNERQLVIADPTLATLQIGGYFRPTNLAAFIHVLQSDFGVRVSADGSRLMLAAAPAK